MELSKILDGVKCKNIKNFKNVEIECITQSSKDVIANSLFFCLSGANFDGKSFAKDVIQKGAIVLVSEENVNENCINVVVEDVRLAMSIMAKNYYEKSDEKLKKVAVVGTNGKTSTCFILQSILKEGGYKVGVIGTNGVYINGQYLPSSLTTPDPIELHYIFHQMLMFGVDIVVMEVSAHAIYYKKLFDVYFDVGIFTNLTNEHLDFFRDMENYSAVKKSFFTKKIMRECVVNVDDKYGVDIAKNSGVPCVSYGINNPSNIFAVGIKITINGTKFYVNVNDEILNISTNLVGEYNVYNILSAIGAAKLLGIANDNIIRGVKKLKNINGRFMVYQLPENKKIVVDFAHTPDGFEKVLSLIKKLRKGKIISVFGCVGYSDAAKRKVMGQVAVRYCDEIIITTDNIGLSDFKTINQDIKEGIANDAIVTEIFDRDKAIEYAFKNLQKNETLVILGKGCEDKQVIGDKKLDYCDIQVVENLLKGEVNE